MHREVAVTGKKDALALGKSDGDSTRIEVVYFGLFDNCNAKCNMCNCWNLPTSRLELDHYQKVMSSVLDMKPKAIRFTGGEPLLFSNLTHLIRQASEAGVRVSVISNGQLLEKKVAQLAESGCSEVVLSLDAIGEHHDLIRGTQGLFERCLKGISSLANADVNYGVNTVLQKQGIDDLPEMTELLLKRPKLPRWWHLIPVRGNPDLTPTAEQIERLREHFPKMKKRLEEQGVSLIADPDLFTERGAKCSVPSFTAYVRADTGNVYGCNMLVYGSNPVGNLLTTSGTEVFGGEPAVKLREKCLIGEHEECSRCDLSSQSMNHFLRKLAKDFHQNQLA